LTNVRDRRTLLLMSVDVGADHELVARVVASTGLPDGQARRVVEDVVAYHREPVEDYVRRRHFELRTYGARNPEIFGRIRAELDARVVAPPDLSERQLRRLVYG
jgi:hypothetical protein